MCVFKFNVVHIRPLVAMVGAHGATDLAAIRQFPPIYLAAYLVPLPPKVVTALFFAASMVHFAEDIGPDGSLALHSVAGFVWLAFGAQRGLEVVLAYLALLHMPAHYIRCWRRRRWGALVAAALATCVALSATRHMRVVSVDHAMQRLVAAHVWTEFCVRLHHKQRWSNVQ